MEFHNDIKYLPVKAILKSSLHVHVMDDSTYDALKSSIEANGFFGAILVRPHPLKSGKFEIIDGEKRFRILKELGVSKVPVIVLDYNDINFAVNMIRFNREHGYFDKEKTNELVSDLIRKTNKLFVRDLLHTGLKEFDELINDSPDVFGDNKSSSSSKYSNILQESEKSKKLFL